MNIYADENTTRHMVMDFFTKICNCQFDFNILKKENIKENSLFLSLGTDFEHSLCFDIEFVEKIKKLKNKSLFILYIGNSINQDVAIRFKDLINKYDFNENNVYIVVQLTNDFNNIYRVIPNVNLFAYDQWIYELFSFTLLPSFFKPDLFLSQNNTMPFKKFSILCKRYTDDRLIVFCHLLKNNLLENFNYTFVADRLHSPIDEIKSDVPSQFDEYRENIYKWIDGIPYEAPGQLSRHNHYGRELEYYYKSSSIHISLETQPQNASYLTEKTYRAIFYKKPFILISQYYALEALKAEGYKTFSPFIDESYDKIIDYNLRLEAVMKEINRLNTLPISELETIVEHCREITEYNYNNLLNYYFRPIPNNFMLSNMLNFN